jgi:hypothetical protein
MSPGRELKAARRLSHANTVDFYSRRWIAYQMDFIRNGGCRSIHEDMLLDVTKYLQDNPKCP